MSGSKIGFNFQTTNNLNLAQKMSSKEQSVSQDKVLQTDEYIVKRGDTLTEIAVKTGQNLQELLQKNRQIKNPNRIYVGQRIEIGKASNVYTVKRGDTLSEIAKAKHTTAGDIIRANSGQIGNRNLIYPGQKLIVPTSVNQSAPTDRKTPPIDKPKQPVSSKPTGTTPPQVENKPKIEQPKATNNGNTSQGQSVSSSGWKVAKVSINDFFNRKQGSTVLAAVIIGHAEGNIDKYGNPTQHYYGHTDPGDKLWNIGSFSRANARFPKSPPARSPQEADQMHLKTLQSDTGKFTNALQKAGLDPENVWLQSTYFDVLNQAGGDIANKMLEPKQLEYVRKNGVTPETMKEWRMRGFINRETGQRWVRLSGRLKNVPFGSSFKTEAALSHDQQRRADAVAEILKNVNLIQKPTTNIQTQSPLDKGNVVNQPIQKQPASINKVETQNTAASNRYYRVRQGVVLSEKARQNLSKIGQEYKKITGKTFVVTSGTRTPYSQADAMLIKIRLGDNFSEYKNRLAVSEILGAYKQAHSSGKSPEEVKQAMARVIGNQVDKGVYISRHLQGGAADVSIKEGLNERAFRTAVKSVTGQEPLYEGKPPHFHFQF